MNDTKCIAIPPVECLENGCRERSERCMKCANAHCIWFYAPVNDNKKKGKTYK